MKITRTILPLAVGIVFTFSMCDYIVIPNDVDTAATSTFDTTKRVALVEEWTGHVCTNCPDAARAIELLKSTYGQNFISISIHDDFFATPCNGAPGSPGLPPCAANAPGAFLLDFRCPTGASYSAYHPDAPQGPPTGMVNRLGMPSQTELRQYTAWASVVDSLVQEDACTSIHIDHTYNTSTRQLGVTAWGTWLQAYTGDVRVAIMLTESGMVGWQLDDQDCNPDFVFHDVLRECINTPGSIAGITADTGTSTIGTTWSYFLPTAYTLPATYDANNCQLVAIFYDATTGEVLQAWEEEL